jgi:hypothetical protein
VIGVRKGQKIQKQRNAKRTMNNARKVFDKALGDAFMGLASRPY